MQRPLPRQSRRRPRPLNPYHPRYWPTWLLLGAAWLAAQLPPAARQRLARLGGRVAQRLNRRRRRVVEANLRLCLPQLAPAARQVMVRRVFESAGLGAMEACVAWFGRIAPLARHTRVDGLQHLRAAQDGGRGVLLLGAHFASMELAGALLTRFAPFAVIYRSSSNAAIDQVMWRGRRRHYAAVIPRTDVRAMLRSLRAGGTLWYAADQDYGARHSQFAPLFGVPAATIVAAQRLVQQTGACVLAVAHYRDQAGHIRLVIQPIDADPVAYNRWLEAAILVAPDQYLWLHRRFKTRPPGAPDIYRQT